MFIRPGAEETTSGFELWISVKTRLNDFSIREHMNFKENKKEKSNILGSGPISENDNIIKKMSRKSQESYDKGVNIKLDGFKRLSKEKKKRIILIKK